MGAQTQKKGQDSTQSGTSRKETTFERRRRRRLKELFGNYELVSLVCYRHVNGEINKNIVKEVKKKFPRVEMTREDPTWIVRRAALKGMLVFRPPRNDDYRVQILERFPTLHRVEVVSSAEVGLVAEESARMLVQMLCKVGQTKNTAHVGVAGGHTVRALMRALADELQELVGGLPKCIHFHALAVGFDPDDPSTNPNAFVTFFDNKLIPANICHTGLNAPAVVTPKMFEELRSHTDIEQAFRAAKHIDIFVTAGSTWHRCGVLRRRMEIEKSDREKLEAAGVVGDLLWRPISRSGPIEVETIRRAFTLVELPELRTYVKKGKLVLATLAPCGVCGQLKGELADCILEQNIVTHLVIDTRSGGQLLGKSPGGGRDH